MKRLLFLSLLFLTVRGWASWTFVQGSTSTTSNGGCGTTTSTITVSANDLVVLGCLQNDKAFPFSGTVTDTNSNSWTLALSTCSTAQCMGVYYTIAKAGAMAADFQPTGCPGVPGCVILDYQGNATSSVYDVGSGSYSLSSNANPISNSATTTKSNDLMVSFQDNDQSGRTINSQTGTARTQMIALSGSWLIDSQDATVASPSSYQSTWTMNAGGDWVVIQAAFEQATAAPAGTGSLIIE
jgi:hypothetical protein